jgi:hypothetical protein
MEAETTNAHSNLSQTAPCIAKSFTELEQGREAYPIKSKHHKTDQSSIAINTAKENKSRKKKSNRMKTYRKTFPKKRGKKTTQTSTQGSKQWSFRSFWRALGDWKT